MEAIAEVLEHELEEAFEVKNKKSLHRYVLLLTDNIIKKESYEKQQLEIKSDIKILAEVVKQGFERMDKRFEAVDKRFEQVDKRFEAVDKHFEQIESRLAELSRRMFQFMIWSFGFTVTAAGVIIAVLKF
jgi:chromosome segregation ATPase